MTEQVLRFVDGAAYEQNMGIWSRLAGEIFLDWLAPPAGLRWIDIGCGNGAFTELLIARCAPAEVQGIDPSDGSLLPAPSRFTFSLSHTNPHFAALLRASPHPREAGVARALAAGATFVQGGADQVQDSRVSRSGRIATAG